MFKLTKTEWLSLRLHSETIFNLVSRLNYEGEDCSAVELVRQLQSELTCMKTMSCLLLGEETSLIHLVKENLEEYS